MSFRKSILFFLLLLTNSSRAQEFYPDKNAVRVIELFGHAENIYCSYIARDSCKLKYEVMEKIQKDARDYKNGHNSSHLLDVFIKTYVQKRNPRASLLSFESAVELVNYEISLRSEIKICKLSRCKKEEILWEKIRFLLETYNYSYESDSRLLLNNTELAAAAKAMGIFGN